MLPTLAGRWQTRILLFVLVGLPVTFLWSLYLGGGELLAAPFLVLLTLLVVGLILDPFYIWLQSFRWERDWPFAFQFAFSILEFAIVLFLIAYDLLPYLPAADFVDARAYQLAWVHFALIFVPSFLMLLGGLQLFLVRWRYKGGELGRMK